MGCPNATQLVMLSDGEVPPHARPSLLAHLDECERCRCVVASLLPSSSDARVSTPDPGVQRVGRYQLTRRLGKGAMGVVYEAVDTSLARHVAVKLLSADKPSELDELIREARLLARLNHPHVVQIFDTGTIDDTLFLAMELAPLGTLRQWIAATQPRPRLIIDAFLQLGTGLAAAHAAHIIHRDFKLDNILVFGTHQAPIFKVADLGLARDLNADEDVTAYASAPDEAVPNTVRMLGTPSYLAPEQWQGQRATAHSDQYAFCVTLFEALLGHKPHIAADLATLRRKVLHEPVAVAKLPLPPAQRAAIARGLAKQPTARFPSIADLLTALAPPRTRLRHRPLAIALGVAAAALLAWWPSAPATTNACDRVGVDTTAGLAVMLPAVQTALTRAGLGNVAARNRALGDLVARWQTHVRTATADICQRHGGPRAKATTLTRRCYDHQTQSLIAHLELLRTPQRQTVAHALDVLTRLSQPNCGETEADLRQWEATAQPAYRALEALAPPMLAKAALQNVPLTEEVIPLARPALALGHTALAARLAIGAGDIQDMIHVPDAREAALALAETVQPSVAALNDGYLHSDLLEELAASASARREHWLHIAKDMAIRTGNFDRRLNLDLIEAFGFLEPDSELSHIQQRNMVEASLANLDATQTRRWDRFSLRVLQALVLDDAEAAPRLTEAIAEGNALFGEGDPATLLALTWGARTAYTLGALAVGDARDDAANQIYAQWPRNPLWDWELAHVKLARLRAHHAWPELFAYSAALRATPPAEIRDNPVAVEFYHAVALYELGRHAEAAQALAKVLTRTPARMYFRGDAERLLARLRGNQVARR